jgi:hypothetical protein
MVVRAFDQGGLERQIDIQYSVNAAASMRCDVVMLRANAQFDDVGVVAVLEV